MEKENLLSKSESEIHQLHELGDSPLFRSSELWAMGILGVLLAVSIDLFPKWLSYIFLALLAGGGIALFRRAGQWRKSVHTACAGLDDSLKRMYEASKGMEDDLKTMGDKLKELQAQTPGDKDEVDKLNGVIRSLRKEIQDLQEGGKDVTMIKMNGRMKSLLEGLQQIDSIVSGLDKSYYDDIHNEVLHCLRRGGYEYLDYDHDKDSIYCYKAEETDIPEMEYDTHAIIDSTSKKLMVKGHVYLPKRN